ncbi:probable mitochondrial processing peptidase alpha chain precursor [Melanopsichium pennsylvanicum]|uniref:Mitochondrial-processing peptidase subunit alpha n=2 Tax=Melanopsichium pennsylvanicum TaxID=63383 RepID=A0AAJ5C586_9BASI|nr:probable mitochondrial processing peptidase alpha chain precursor [Melanopsichium pennsylvanicum 4]SNX84313.1 probable mitochondrial processing peptidase alpha chain precursor [Melanopsichium pennsylvanicum]
MRLPAFSSSSLVARALVRSVSTVSQPSLKVSLPARSVPAAQRSLSDLAAAAKSGTNLASALNVARQSQFAQNDALARSVSSSATASAPAASAVASSSTDSPYASPLPTSSLINVTTLPNLVRVATEATPGHFSAVGVYIDAGSRYERPWVAGESGSSHLLDRLAFKSTTNRSSQQMTSEIEALGGNVMCSSSRETIMYQSSVFNKDVSAVLSILADTILNPLLSPEELDLQREAAAYEIQEIWSKPEMILPELLHTTAYQGNTLGNPLLCPIESLEQMTADNLRNFMSNWYRPERIVVAGSGMPHEQLVELSEKLFGDLKPLSDSARLNFGSSSLSSSPSSSSSSSSSSSRSSSLSSLFSRSSSSFSTSSSSSATPTSSELADLVATPSEYTGGELYIPQSDLEFTHVYVAFEGLSIHDDDIYALATLQILLGGGGSFSAGGPGKGMYSRLYTNVLNQHHSVDYCAAFHHCYSDSGLFGISASVHPSFNASIVHVIARELELCTSSIYQGSVTQAELNRAKNQLKSSLVMALESRLVEVEDLGRQIQAHGKKVSVEEMCDRIDQVDLKTLNRVASRVLRPQKAKVGTTRSPRGSSQATVVAQGNLDGLGDVRDLLARRGLGVSPKQA